MDELIRRGHRVLLSSRQAPRPDDARPVHFLRWPLDETELKDHLLDLEVCIHLAGESVGARRWTEKQKDKIFNSRVEGTRQVVDLLRAAPRLHTFLSASAVGYYGDRGDEELTESSPLGKGFLSEVCYAWENEAAKLNRLGLRQVFLRTGAVFGRGGGMLQPLEPLFKFGLGGTLGKGTQFMSWIHLRDWLDAILFILENAALEGPVNVTSPSPATNRAFTYAFSAAFGRKPFLPVPRPLIKLMLGEMSHLALDSQYALPAKLLAHRYKFKFPNLETALLDLYADAR